MKHPKITALIAAATIALSGGILFAGTPAARQAQTAKKAQAASTSMHATVKSISSSQLVVTEKGKNLTFAVNGDTQKVGDIKAGTPVTIQYHFDSGKDLVTRIQAMPGKTSKGR